MPPDGSPSLPQERQRAAAHSNASGPRLSQLFVWMTACAVYFALARRFLPDVPHGLYQHLLLAAISLYTGLCWTGVVEVLVAVTSRRGRIIEPGSWFLFALGSVLAADLVMEFAPPRYGLRPEPIQLSIRCLALAIPMLSRRLAGHWKFVFLTFTLLAAAKLVWLIAATSWDWPMSPAALQSYTVVRSVAGLLLIGWGIVRDRQLGRHGGWLHWLGLVAAIIWIGSEFV